MSTIADLIIEAGRNAAEARAASGATWGRAVENIGQIPGQVLGASQQRQDRQQAQALAVSRDARETAAAADESKLRNLQIAGVQQGQAQQHALDTIWGSGIIKDDGSVDTKKAQDLAVQAGMPHLVPAIIDQANKWNASAVDLTSKQEAAKRSAIELQNAQRDQLGVDAQDLKANGYDPGTFQLFVAKRAKDGVIPADQANALIMSAHADPTVVQKTVDNWIQGSKSVAAARNAGLKEVPKEGSLVDVNTIDPKTGLPKVVATGAPADKKLEQKPVLLDGKSAIVNYDPQTGKHTDASGADVSARVKPIPPASTIINPALVPSGDALTMAARKYLADGTLPAMGMGQAGAAARVAVMNEAAKIDPRASLAANKATYGADTKNLANLQKTEGTLSAFEKTAGKNLDQFLSLADKIPDTGVPWLNQPIRAVNDKALGSADQAAFNAARDVALREIARVTNDPKLSGVLSDAARKEVSALSPSAATFAQIKSVAQVLKQDMANVHAGINEQIGTVKAGLQGHPGAPAPTVDPKDPLGILGK